MKKIVFISLISISIFIACSKKVTPATSATTPAKTEQATAPIMGKTETGPATAAGPIQPVAVKTDEALVEQGKMVYNAKCGRCHVLKATGDFTASRWDGILRDMMPKAKLNTDEQNQVIAYVKANAKK